MTWYQVSGCQASRSLWGGEEGTRKKGREREVMIVGACQKQRNRGLALYSLMVHFWSSWSLRYNATIICMVEITQSSILYLIDKHNNSLNLWLFQRVPTYQSRLVFREKWLVWPWLSVRVLRGIVVRLVSQCTPRLSSACLPQKEHSPILSYPTTHYQDLSLSLGDNSIARTLTGSQGNLETYPLFHRFVFQAKTKEFWCCQSCKHVK